MIAFLFPGQGSQKLGTGKDIYDNFETARNIYNKASKILEKDIAKLCFESSNEEVFKANSRVKKMKLTLDNKVEYIIELEDTMNSQLIDIAYTQEPSFDKLIPIEATFEILEVYPGEKYQDTAITTLTGSVYTNMPMGG